MRFTNLVFLVALGIFVVMASACGSNTANAQPTRVATQTPYIVFVPVTTTPEPATVTPLATITPEVVVKTATRTATRAVVVVRPTVTKTSPPAPVGPSSTAAPACAFAAPTVTEPDERAEVRTFENRPGTGAFIFKWIPPPSIGGDDIAYKIQLDSKSSTTGKPVNGDTVYITHSKYMSEGQGQRLVYDSNRVWGMKQGGDGATVYYYVSVVKFKGNIDDSYHLVGSAVECTGSRTALRAISLIVLD